MKKRNLASVTKCQNCNGSGIVFVGGNKNKNNQANADKPFHCNICGGSFSRYSSLWSHKKLHSGEKNFKCGICGIAFAKAVYLKNHSRIHTGEKPYRLPIFNINNKKYLVNTCQTCHSHLGKGKRLKAEKLKNYILIKFSYSVFTFRNNSSMTLKSRGIFIRG